MHVSLTNAKQQKYNERILFWWKSAVHNTIVRFEKSFQAAFIWKTNTVHKQIIWRYDQINNYFVLHQVRQTLLKMTETTKKNLTHTHRRGMRESGNVNTHIHIEKRRNRERLSENWSIVIYSTRSAIEAPEGKSIQRWKNFKNATLLWQLYCFSINILKYYFICIHVFLQQCTERIAYYFMLILLFFSM